MTILGIDYGQSHVGVAIGDTETKLALPLRTFSGLPRLSLVDELRTVVKAYKAAQVVVGVPHTLRPDNGSVGTLEKEVEEFAQQLRVLVDVPIHLVDERFTSDAAQKLRQENPHADEHSLAAMLILQTYFDQQR